MIWRFFLGFCALLPLWGAGSDAVFRSDVSLVRVDAQVVDRNNRAITGLSAGDFVLREEGQSQPIRNFASEEMPVDVLLLLDVSASMRPHVQRIASAAHQAFQVLHDQDRIGMMVFDRSTRLRLSFRNSRDAAEHEFQALLREETFDGGTDITRGLLDAAEYVAREARPEARLAVVILTDDQTQRDRDEEAVSRALTRANAVLSALIAPDAMRYNRGVGRHGGGLGMGGPLGGIILGRGGPYGGGGPGGGYPRTHSAGTAEIARASGGDSLPVDDASALETTLSRIRQRYALFFYLPQGVGPGQERSIEVALASSLRTAYPGAEVRYRRTYMAPSGATQVAGNAPAPESRTLKRRPAVDQPGSREGPLDTTSQGGWPRAAAPADPQPSHGGWRRVKPGEQ